MKNDSYVVHRLDEWSLDRIRREDNGTGWPSKLPGYDGMPMGDGSHTYTPPISEACGEVDKCVCAVGVVNKTLYEVIMLTYVYRSVTNEQKFKRLGCCKQTYYNHLGRAHQMVLEYLNDLAAGVALPRVDVKALNNGS